MKYLEKIIDKITGRINPDELDCPYLDICPSRSEGKPTCIANYKNCIAYKEYQRENGY